MRSRVLRIESNDGALLTIDRGDEPVPLHWDAALSSSGLSAAAELDNDPILFSQPTLCEYFADLALGWRGWRGVQSWRAGALAFDARHDGLGHVSLAVELGRDLHDSWRVTVPLHLDAGSLDHLAREVSGFVEGLEFGGDERLAETS